MLFKGILDQLIQQAALEQSVADKLTKRDTLRSTMSAAATCPAWRWKPWSTAAVTEEALQAAYDARFKDAAPATEYQRRAYSGGQRRKGQ